MGWDGVSFARRLAVLMAERGIASQTLAEQAGLSYSQIQRLKRGERKQPPSKAELAAIANVLDVPVDALANGEGFPAQPVTLQGVDGVALAGWMDGVEERLERLEEATETRTRSLEHLVQRLTEAGVIQAP